ncbi:ATP-binding protein [Mesorhizobium sp.]|uniref:ATP-binding protein n=1 Tax=Mesorhizobium sp. TaxID=1871066 RepID=UPI002580BB04|nr:ATP-binding protein [Mesorhizobium sp.]
MLAVYHLATRKSALSDLAGIPALVDRAGLMDVPQAHVAVLDGTAHAPGQPWKRGGQAIKTLWGELAWQLGGAEGFTLVAESDATGTSPGKDVLRELLERHSPCVVLIDELVAYIRQFQESQAISGGSYDSNLSFVQALTEAVKLVPRAIVLASLPESDLEAGSHRGIAALRALEKTFGRVQALWKPVATEEAFEIVRRRLFEPVRDERTRETVCRAFADAYIAEGVKLPADTQERHYYDRLLHAYPIHPEVFDRLYEDWTTIDGFQRTRGVLKLMAKVIFRLWKDDNKDLLIMPGSLPLYDGSSRNELTYYLPAGWDAVIERDIDGDRAETTALENKEPRFGQVGAARRIARTVFLGSAPSSVASKVAARGLDRAHIILGCLQPGQASSVYADALGRLADRLHYLNTSDDKAQDSTRFWFDTRANLRREMEDRKRRFDDRTEVRGKIAEALKKTVGNTTSFDGVHIFTPHGDVPDDTALRLVVLPPETWYAREESRLTFEAVLEIIGKNGAKPRYRSNRLLFLAADHGALSRLNDATRVALAWGSIVEDIKESRLTIDNLQQKQAEKELKSAEDALPRIVRECYKWLLCPMQDTPTDPKPGIEAFAVNASGGSLSSEIERICTDNELVIATWSPIHLRTKLKELYWKGGQIATNAAGFFEDTLRYLYMPRLKTRDVLTQAIRAGATSHDFFGTAYGETNGKFEGFSFGGGNVVFDDTLLLIEPQSARAYDDANRPTVTADKQIVTTESGVAEAPGSYNANGTTASQTEPVTPTSTAAATRPKTFYGSAEVPPATAKMRLVQIAEEIVSVLSTDPNATIRLVVEISAEFPEGASDSVKRAVSENARSLGLKSADWE